jgi:hypothetical protein
LPCGITSDTTTLEIAPHIGWVALKPDAVGQVDISVKGSRLQFQGPAYHDKVPHRNPKMNDHVLRFNRIGRTNPLTSPYIVGLGATVRLGLIR